MFRVIDQNSTGIIGKWFLENHTPVKTTKYLNKVLTRVSLDHLRIESLHIMQTFFMMEKSNLFEFSSRNKTKNL